MDIISIDKMVDSYKYMNENIIDIKIDNIKQKEFDFLLTRQTLFIKIDARGNVNIQKQIIFINSFWPHYFLPFRCFPIRTTRLIDVLVINDNVEIPDYLINMIKKLFVEQENLYVPHYEKIIESIKILKHSLRLEFSERYYSEYFTETI
jgi:hypothetical protein